MVLNLSLSEQIPYFTLTKYFCQKPNHNLNTTWFKTLTTKLDYFRQLPSTILDNYLR